MIRCRTPPPAWSAWGCIAQRDLSCDGSTSRCSRNTRRTDRNRSRSNICSVARESCSSYRNRSWLLSMDGKVKIIVKKKQKKNSRQQQQHPGLDLSSSIFPRSFRSRFRHFTMSRSRSNIYVIAVTLWKRRINRTHTYPHVETLLRFAQWKRKMKFLPTKENAKLRLSLVSRAPSTQRLITKCSRVTGKSVGWCYLSGFVLFRSFNTVWKIQFRLLAILYRVTQVATCTTSQIIWIEREKKFHEKNFE